MEFAVIFTQMSWVPALLIAVGLIFFFVEIFVPGFGFFGISGILSMAIGVVVRICDGLDVAQSLTLIIMLIVACWIMLAVMVVSAKHGILGKTGLFENSSSLPANYNKVDKELKSLVGKSGKAITKLSKAGKAKIKGKVYNVISATSLIEAGSNIKVVEIKDNNIMVRKWFE